jgi:Domain of unknown function (DUF4190)
MSTSEPPSGLPQAPPPPPPQQVVYAQGPQQGNGMATTGFVCGLLAAIFGVIPFVFYLSFPLGIIGIVFSYIGLRRANREPERGGRGLAIAGLVLGIIGLVLAVLWIAVIAAALEETDDILDDLDITTTTP